MKKMINKEIFLKLKRILLERLQVVLRLVKSQYQRSSFRQRMLVILVLAIFFVLLLLSIVLHHSSSREAHKPLVISFNKPIATRISDKKTSFSVQPTAERNRLNSQIQQWHLASQNQLQSVQEKLDRVQSHLSDLASQQDIEQLKQVVAEPNKDILNKMSVVQNTVNRLVKQSLKKAWVNPASVEQYFRLVAVQGFSDGMRAIIDVNGHQTVLGIKEICPACRGWRLKSLDFANQSAIFIKSNNSQIRYVKLQAN